MVVEESDRCFQALVKIKTINKNNRNFLLLFRELKISKRFSLNSLTQNRLDVLLRCISSVFFLSNTFRHDTTLFIIGENEHEVLQLEGSRIKGLNPDERAIAGWLRKNLRSEFDGFSILSMELNELLEHFKNIYILNQHGNFILQSRLNIKGSLFVVGSIGGYFEADMQNLKTFGGKLLSIGSGEYLASSTITNIQWYIDLEMQFNNLRK